MGVVLLRVAVVGEYEFARGPLKHEFLTPHALLDGLDLLVGVVDVDQLFDDLAEVGALGLAGLVVPSWFVVGEFDNLISD